MKFKSLVLIFILLVGAAVFSAPAALAYTEPQIAAEDKSVEEGLLEDILPTLVRKKIGKLELDFSASSTFGYDSNYNLNRYDEETSCFMQEAFGIKGRYPMGDMFVARGSYDFSSIKYFRSSDPDLIDNLLGAGLDTKVTDNIVWTMDYLADFVGFPHDHMSEYVMNQVETGLNHDITDWLYQRISYQFSRKDFHEIMTRDRLGTTFRDRRRDQRNTAAHEIGLYIGENTLLKANNAYYYNDSNETYMRYYDYWGYKTRGEVDHIITDKLYGTAYFGYEYKDYDKRSLTDDLVDLGKNENQRDHVFNYGGSLFYDVIPSISIGTTVDYTDNISNENYENYEDLVITGGIYASF